MLKVNFSFLFPLLTLFILVFALSQQMFNVFPIGKLLDPFAGAVQNGSEKELQASGLIMDKMGLADSVHIFFDKRKVPHIYAKNTEDLYFAQGYVTASLRLWQMDFLSYVSAGRLSEIFSSGFIEYDRKQRRMGILAAAKTSLAMIEKDRETIKVLTAYTKGVNAYIGQLSYKKLPVEYKLLDYEPEPWSNLKTVLIMKYMANVLSGYEEDLSMSNMMVALGEGDFNKIFPDFPVHSTPVVNDPAPKSDPISRVIRKPDYLDYSFLTAGGILPDNSFNPKLGSNSWAVSGRKTKSGFPILCSDPHLNLSLPSIWIEMQLSSPGMNVYGVSIPGTPAVIIGFNEDIAWGITNGADDVKDWYKLKISPDYKKYEFDGKWIDLDYSVEEIKRRGQAVFYDTVYQAIQGPVVNNKSFSTQPLLNNYALKWELHRPSNEFLVFIELNKAKNYKDYKEAISHNSCPTENFTFACKDNTIAIDHEGSMAIKWPGEGKFILDGTKRSHLYTKYIPEDSLPHLLDPSCNYVLSANQRPTSADYAYYYNGYYSENRANRIKQMLENESDFDIKKMEAMQLDNRSAFAADALPVLLKSMHADSLTAGRRTTLGMLSGWKGDYDLNDENAKLFELWWNDIKKYTWDKFREFPFYSKSPDDYVLLDLIRKDPGNEYFDRQGTEKKENAGDIVGEAFIAAVTAYDSIRKEGSVKWGDLNKINIMHLTNIPAFSRMNLHSSGHPEAINAMSANWGPSWRMVVELGDRPKAFGIYGGGQSGAIGSAYYDDFVQDWNKGIYYPLAFFMSMNEAKDYATGSWILK